METPTPQLARQQLIEAERIGAGLLSFNPAWVTYVFLCAGGAITTICLSFANTTDLLDPNIALPCGLAWSLVGVILTLFNIGTSSPARRRFGLHWGIMLALWAVCYAAAMILVNRSASPNQAVLMTLPQLALAFAGAAMEILANLKAQKVATR